MKEKDKNKLKCLVHPSRTRIDERGYVYWDEPNGCPRVLDYVHMQSGLFFVDWEGAMTRKEDVSGLDKETRIGYWRLFVQDFLADFSWNMIDDGTINYVVNLTGGTIIEEIDWKAVNQQLLQAIILTLQNQLIWDGNV